MKLEPGEAYAIGSESTATAQIVDVRVAPRFRPTRVTRLPDGPVSLELELPPSGTYLIEASADLKAWSPIQTVDGGSATIEIRDESARADQQRFYRARSVE